MNLTGWIFKGVHVNAGHSGIGNNIAFGQGLFTLTCNGKTTWRLLHWKQNEQVRLLKCIWTVCCLANFVYGLMGEGSDGEYGHVGTHSLPLILTTSVKYGKLPAMYNCGL